MESFDTKTIAVAIEYVIAYSQETCNCPVVFYTGTQYDNEHYAQMVDLLLEIQEKWGIDVIYLAAWATEIFCVIRIIASDDNPDYKVPWLLFVLIIPIAGFMLYFMFYSRKLQKKFIKRMDNLKSHTYAQDDSELFSKLRKDNPTAAAQAK